MALSACKMTYSVKHSLGRPQFCWVWPWF